MANSADSTGRTSDLDISGASGEVDAVQDVARAVLDQITSNCVEAVS